LATKISPKIATGARIVAIDALWPTWTAMNATATCPTRASPSTIVTRLAISMIIANSNCNGVAAGQLAPSAPTRQHEGHTPPKTCLL